MRLTANTWDPQLNAPHPSSICSRGRSSAITSATPRAGRPLHDVGHDLRRRGENPVALPAAARRESAHSLVHSGDRFGLHPSRQVEGGAQPSPTDQRARVRRRHGGGNRAPRQASDPHELAAPAGPHGPRRRRGRPLLRELRLARARLAEALPGRRPARSCPLPDRVRRGCRERRRAAVPARLPRQDRHAAADAGRQARARGDRALDHLARAGRRGRVPAALDLRDRDQLLELPDPADPRRALRRRRLRHPGRRPAPRRGCRSSPGGPASRGSPARVADHPRGNDAGGDRRLVVPARLLDHARAREHAAAGRARRRLLADARARRPLPRRPPPR